MGRDCVGQAWSAQEANVTTPTITVRREASTRCSRHARCVKS
jgi:hypothetical protein